MSHPSVEQIALALQRQYGVDAETARLRAAATVGEMVKQSGAPPTEPAEEKRRADLLEKHEQNAVRKIFVAHGCAVYNLSQSRATKQTPGLPDLFVFSSRSGHAFWFETKRPVGGVQSRPQREFQERCAQCGVRYVIGGQTEAWALLREFRLLD